jgi:hypothetical protein
LIANSISLVAGSVPLVAGVVSVIRCQEGRERLC